MASKWNRSEQGRPRALRCAAFVIVALAALLLLALTVGCGLQTEEANKDLSKANAHQQEAEAVIARLKVLPNDWQTIFNTPTATAAQIANGRQLVAARVADLDVLDTALKNWGIDNRAILKLNVEQKAKDYVSLKAASIKQWQQYAETYLRPLVKAYGGLLDAIAQGKTVEQQAAADNIKSIVSEALTKLEDCRNAEKQAESYFKANKLGK